MKYMGSKQWMLKNGLGDILVKQLNGSRRFVDLFAGSGAVACYVAEHFPLPVLASDLQTYSMVLSGAIICRVTKLDWKPVWRSWCFRAEEHYKKYRPIPLPKEWTQKRIDNIRKWASEQIQLPITKAYGGHYFSPVQAVWIDSFRSTLPDSEPDRTVALSALIQSVSQCVASPGHTAQPFQPTQTANSYLQQAWNRDLAKRTEVIFSALAKRNAMRSGRAVVSDATEAAKKLKSCDVTFIDPPYSSVQYSRFYHVLETVAHGDCGAVTGAGRYPVAELRPRSKFSLKTAAVDALDELLKIVSAHGSRSIVTFPEHKCSNGLSGEMVRKVASKYFHTSEKYIESKFSTLGGTGDGREKEAGRSARQYAKELILILKPR